MANHGYLGEGYGKYGDVDDDDRARRRDWRGEDREGAQEWIGGRDRARSSGERGWDSAREGWGSGSAGRSREGGSDFSRGRGEWAQGGQDRGSFMERARDTARSWMRDDDDDDRPRGARISGYGREHGSGGFQGDYGGGRSQGGFGGRGDWDNGRQNMSPRGESRRERSGGQQFGYNDLSGTTGGFGNQTFASSPHDHYLSWRERQIAELDRDYQDYCREREQSFHQDFDSWRQSRQSQQSAGGGAQADQTEAQNSGSSGSNAGADTQAMGQAGSTPRRGSSAPQEPLELTTPSSAATLGEAETPRGGAGS